NFLKEVNIYWLGRINSKN
ncbi:Thymidine kinase, partial [Haemophilus influenzae]